MRNLRNWGWSTQLQAVSENEYYISSGFRNTEGLKIRNFIIGTVLHAENKPCGWRNNHHLVPRLRHSLSLSLLLSWSSRSWLKLFSRRSRSLFKSCCLSLSLSLPLSLSRSKSWSLSLVDDFLGGLTLWFSPRCRFLDDSRESSGGLSFRSTVDFSAVEKC